MFIRKVKSEGIAHLSYIIGGDGKAAVVDPRRDCQIYLDIAEEEGVRIAHILETHRNEDYVIGSLELAARTGARIHHGDLGFGYGEVIRDGDEIKLGQVTMRAVSTPGHTPESISYTIIDRSSGPEVIGVFTGDTMFVGEVGRTDLLGADRTEQMAAKLFDSLHQKLLPLGDAVILYPAHGSGSVCGGAIANREESTIGLERFQNPALRFGNKEDFVRMKLNEGLEKPYYFTNMEEVNLAGTPLGVLVPRPPPLDPSELKAAAETGTQILDVRPPHSYAAAHIPGTVSIPLEVLPNYAGWALSYDRPIMLVADEDRDVPVAVRELFRVGYDQVTGYLHEGMLGWTKAGLPYEMVGTATPAEVYRRLKDGARGLVLDIRTLREWREGRAEGATHIFVGHLARSLQEIPKDQHIDIVCSSGLRGSLAASILLTNGYRDMSNMLGGMGGWKKAGLPVIK